MVNNIYNKILIIDDDEDLSFIICEMLESYGYNVTCAESSEKALSYWRAIHITLFCLI